MSELPLDGLRVLELADGHTDMCGRLLADLGAQVVRVRFARRASSSARGFQHNGADWSFPVQNANKLVIDVDLDDSSQKSRLAALIARADLLFESFPPGELAMRGLGADDLLAINSRLTVVSITPFGQDGPYRDWVATDWVLMALNSVLSRSGLPNQPPLMPPGSLAEQTAAVQAAWAGLVAYWHMLASGRGQHVDFSILEASMQTMDPAFGIAGSATGGVPASDLPPGRPDARHMYPIFPCADGHVRICILAKRQWQGMFKWLGEPEEFADPKYDQIHVRFSSAGTLYPMIGKLFSDKVRSEIVQAGQLYGVPTESLQTATEVLSTPHFRERGAFVDMEFEPGTSGSVPHGFLEVDDERVGIRNLAKVITLDELETLWQEAPRIGGPVSGRRFGDGPLAGLRVLDLGVIVAGAEPARLLGDMGADVIKVENRAFPDGSRAAHFKVDMSASFAWGHRNKRSFGVDLRSEEGKAIFLKLVAQSDVVLSNFKPGTLNSLGLGNDVLMATNPDVVCVDSSALGRTGPWSSRMGYGPLVRAVTGLTQAWRYPDQSEGFCDSITVYPDHTAARVAAVASLACLLRRRRVGGGATASIAQAEVLITQFSSEFLRESIEPNTFVARGNVGEFDAPYGVYPCMGEDQWCVVTVRGDDDWINLCSVIGATELGADVDLSSSEGRVLRRREIDAVVRSWTELRSPREVAERLQAVGVPAAPMNRVNDLRVDPHLVEREFFQILHQPPIGDIPTEGAPARFSGSNRIELRPAPLHGEHTLEIAKELLELDDVAIAELIVRGVLEAPL